MWLNLTLFALLGAALWLWRSAHKRAVENSSLYEQLVRTLQSDKAEAVAQSTLHQAVFNSMVEESFGCTVSDPLICGHSFAFVLEMDLRMKGKERERVSELCVYQVKNDQVAMEQFFM